MNRQIQRFRTLEELIRENMIDMDEFTLDKLEALSKRLVSYRYSVAVDLHKDLLKVINFTKIADMLHLITEYGIVSTEILEKSARSRNKKKFIILSLRRSHTDKYLQQYDLQDVDLSLYKIYPDPIGRRDRDRWYEVALEMLFNEFRRIDLEINYQSNCLYFTDEDGDRQCINDFSISRFVEFLEIMMHTSKIFDYQRDWSKKDSPRFVMSLVTNEQFRTNESQDIED